MNQITFEALIIGLEIALISFLVVVLVVAHIKDVTK
jgi:hypothetical protein